MMTIRLQALLLFPPALLLLCLMVATTTYPYSTAAAFSPNVSSLTKKNAPRTLTTSQRRSTSISDDNTVQEQQQQQEGNNDPAVAVIPITILSGFLGSGKTSLLTQLLQNKEGLRIAVVVNDVASVNIDSKLVQQQQRRRLPSNAADDEEEGATLTDNNPTVALSDGLVELQNGCACCSLSDELLSSVSELVTLSQLRDGNSNSDGGGSGAFQHIVVEMSGVADPKQVRAKFQEAALAGMPLMDYVRLDTMVTVVDASMFESYFSSQKMASRKETPELFYSDGQVPPAEEEALEEEEWMNDMPPKLLEAVMAGLRGTHLEDGSNGVAELLVSQTETADVLVLNKCDLVDSEKERQRLREIVMALNPRASIVETTYGQAQLSSILAVAEGEGVAASGAVDDHREYVAAAMQAIPSMADSHSHSHDNAVHSNDHDKPSPTADSSHSHNHDHDCADPSCSDESHSHSHSHSHQAEDACADPTCNDQGHSHVHSHSHQSSSNHAGIGTFVYRARRPFHPARMISFLKCLPIVRGIPDEEEDQGTTAPLKISADAKEILQSAMRSKGFCWSADSHSSAMYWSHAGSTFEWMCLGQWWATLPRNQWPEGIDEYVLQDFDDPSHDDNSSSSSTVGDRRQEVVFIGPQFDSAEKQRQIQSLLDKCLLTVEEYKEYQSLQRNENKLQVHFQNIMESKYVNF